MSGASPAVAAKTAVNSLNSGGYAARTPRPTPFLPKVPSGGSAARAAANSLNNGGYATRAAGRFATPESVRGAIAAARARSARAALSSKSLAAQTLRSRPAIKGLPKVIPASRLSGSVVPLFGAASLFYGGVDFLEKSAPGVHDWLRGGWKGATPTGRISEGIGGRCPTNYKVRLTYTHRFHGQLTGVGWEPVVGPIAGVQLRPGLVVSGFQQYTAVLLVDSGTNYPTHNLGPLLRGRLDSVNITRLDGLPDSCETRVEDRPLGYPPTKAGAPQSRNPAPDGPGTIGSPPQTPQTAPPTVPKEKPRGFPIPDFFDGPLPFPPIIPGKAPTPGDQPKPEPDKAPFPSDPGGCTSGCNATLKAGQNALNDELKEQTSKLNDLLSKLDAAANVEIIRRLQIVDDKLGPQIIGPTGSKIGIAGRLTDMASNADKWFRRLGGDRALQALTLAASLHNAAMLSNNLGQTLTAAISNVLASVGVKDADNQPLDIGQILGQRWQDFVVSTIGLENYTQLSIAWLRANRIMQAGANIINSIQSIRMSIMSALEAIGSMSGRMANALKRFGVVGDSAYPWFNPSPNYDNRFFQALENAENFTSNIDQVASEVLSAQETITQLGQQKTDLDNSLTNGTEQALPDNVQQFLKRQEEKTASTSPDIEDSDLIKPEPEV